VLSRRGNKDDVEVAGSVDQLCGCGWGKNWKDWKEVVGRVWKGQRTRLSRTEERGTPTLQKES
jgi:hypothetical protein